ncbi:hypothetical protein C5H23_11325 [Xylella fastidiosa]|nr:hypothetical protein KBP49_04315 [Xylella fastidiosa subsp. multiplex]QTX30525.1 hypothetical protein KBP48_03155 [Xylella fastidiosa subsp. multiplex]TNV88342.1 hypothetical protein C5H23_11325 [Xylella fastidiosa]TNV94105.1 hypothetical protein C5H22_09590 [Xylella fastidiosa]
MVLLYGLSNMTRTVLLRYSKDGGCNWSAWVARDLGDIGVYQKRVRRYRLGQGRRWVFDIRITDPVVANLLAMSLQAATGPA